MVSFSPAVVLRNLFYHVAEAELVSYYLNNSCGAGFPRLGCFNFIP